MSYGGKDVSILSIKRNYYGVLHVLKKGNLEPYVIQLVNGNIVHGDQTFGVNKEYQPSTYYTKDSGVGLAIANHPKKINKMPLRIGAIGLGVGTVAAYCGKNDSIRFYEINPQDITIAESYFTYLSNARKNGCAIDIVQGDARVSLERESQNAKKNIFDLLIVDAFTGDTIPTHLLTDEAIKIYFDEMADEGVVAIHVSNKYLDLRPVLEAEAGSRNLFFQFVENGGSSWVLLSKKYIGAESYVPTKSLSSKPWSDDYSNLFLSLRRP